MKQYTIYCTEEQTKKALELGAPIMTFGYEDLGDIKEKVLSMNKQAEISKTENGGIIVGQIPTAEQMIGWLEGQGFVIEIILSDEEENPWTFVINKNMDVCVYSNRKETTLAAIDATLEYLSKKK